MEDVLIICVRENLEQAEAIGEMLDAARFNISEEAVNDASLARCGAAVIVWSRNSVYCSTFADAAARALAAGKAVIACLYEDLTQHDFGAPTIDLSHWDGDADSAHLDALLFAVQKLVLVPRPPLFLAAEEGPAAKAEEIRTPKLKSEDWLPANDAPKPSPLKYAAVGPFAGDGAELPASLRFSNVSAESLWAPAPESEPEPAHAPEPANETAPPKRRLPRVPHMGGAMMAAVFAALVGTGGVAASLHINRAPEAPPTRADAVSFSATLLEDGIDGLNVDTPPVEEVSTPAPRARAPAEAPRVRIAPPPARMARAPERVAATAPVRVAAVTPQPAARRATPQRSSTPRATTSWDRDNPLADLPPAPARVQRS